MYISNRKKTWATCNPPFAIWKQIWESCKSKLSIRFPNTEHRISYRNLRKRVFSLFAVLIIPYRHSSGIGLSEKQLSFCLIRIWSQLNWRCEEKIIRQLFLLWEVLAALIPSWYYVWIARWAVIGERTDTNSLSTTKFLQNNVPDNLPAMDSAVLFCKYFRGILITVWATKLHYFHSKYWIRCHYDSIFEQIKFQSLRRIQIKRHAG